MIALGILGEHLPAALNHVLLQADLTAVAPGYLSPELSEKLLLMADAEGQGPATIYRFSTASVRRALEAGQDAASLLAFLREHSATAVPQPLEYLVEDTASRHGRLRVGMAASFVQSDDETAVLELAAEVEGIRAWPGEDRPDGPDFHGAAARNGTGPARPRTLPLGGGIRAVPDPAAPHHAGPGQRAPGLHRAADRARRSRDGFPAGRAAPPQPRPLPAARMATGR